MGFLGSIGKALGGVIKQVAPSIIKAVAPAATKLLQGVVGDLFTKGGAALSKLAGNLPGPLGGLAQGLLGKFLPKLQDMAQGGIEKLISKLADSITSRLAPGAGTVSLPGIADAARQAAIAANSVSSAASAATAAPTASTSSAASGLPTTSTSSGYAGSAGTSSSGRTVAPDPANYDMKSVEGQAKFNKDMTEFQQALQNMQMYWQMISNMVKSQGDTQRSLVGNLR